MKPIKAPDMPSRLTETTDHHRGGDCKCDRMHVGGRSYMGHSWCMICCLLSPRPKRLRINKDLFRFMRPRYHARMATDEVKAIAYLRQVIDDEQRHLLRKSFRLLDHDEWLAANHHGAGRECRNLLRKVGFTDRSFTGGSLDDTYLDLLSRAVGMEIKQ